MRRVGAVILGIVLAFVIVQLAETGVHSLYPFPPGMNPKDMTAIKAFVATLPPTAFVLVLLGWLIGTFVGTFTAAKIGQSRFPAYVVGGMLFVAGIVNALIIPQPMWFTAASLVIYVGATLVGAQSGAAPTSRAPETA